MTKPVLFITVSLIAIVITITIFAFSQSKPPVTIAYTYGVSGYLEPCGCSSQQMGGFAQRAVLFDKLKSQKIILPIDGGKLVADGKPIDLLKFKIAIELMDNIS